MSIEARHAYLNAQLRVIKAILAGQKVPLKVRRRFGYHAAANDHMKKHNG